MSKPAKTGEVMPRTPNLLSRFQDDIDRMERMFEGFWPMRLTRGLTQEGLSRFPLRAPAVDVFEEGDDVVVKAEIPGASKDDIEINLTDSMLTISGQKERKEEIKEEQYYRCERSYGSFSRSVDLPTEVQSDKAMASFTEGVLEIRLPKTEESKRKSVKLKIK